MLGGLGFSELIIILIIVVVIFGGKRLPELGRGIGEAMKNFKKAVSGQDEGPRESIDNSRRDKNDSGKPV